MGEPTEDWSSYADPTLYEPGVQELIGLEV